MTHGDSQNDSQNDDQKDRQNENEPVAGVSDRSAAEPTAAGRAAAEPTAGDRAAAEAAKRQRLSEWSASLAAELGLPGLQVDIDDILMLAGTAAHAVLRPAAPLTTYLVGFAAGRASALDGLTSTEATDRASRVAAALARSSDR